ncbi:cache domain-containing sensor histidine kinase [Cohnella kolymensis]|nr:sensor histidine kinase [Cohnella kolymensis]
MAISIFLPVALLGYLSYGKSKEQLESVSSQFLEDNVRLNAQQINNFFVNVEKQSQNMMASLELQKVLTKKPPKTYSEEVSFINRMIEIIIQRQGPYELYVIPKDMRNYPNYMKLINTNKIELRPKLFELAFQQQGKGVWFHVWDENTKKPVFIYIRAVRSSYYYEPIGVIAYQIPDDTLREEFVLPSSFHNYQMMMVDSEDKIISHPNANLYNQKYSTTGGWSTADMKLNEQGWKLIAAVPTKDLTGNIDQIQNFTVWIVIGSLLFISLFLSLIVRSLTLPIKRLVTHMVKVRTGALGHFGYNDSRTDEIGQLVRGYNQMISGMSDMLERTKEMEADKRRHELETLNHQINPHFFYNTLDAIKWRAESANQNNIASMVTKLANLLRFSLNNDKEWTTVEREIEHARNYLEIELLRSNRAFQMYFQVDPETIKLKVIKLILQPIMENAVKHGINKLPEGKGKIRLTVKRSDLDIIFIIEDNGPGSSEPIELEVYNDGESERQHGIGLSNVNKRLKLHFGNDYGIHIQSNPGQGFRVQLRHPIISEV